MSVSSHFGVSAVSFTAEQSSAVQAELTAILRSPSFSGSKRCQDFLESIIRHALDGNYEHLTERFLGAELFGRSIDYDTGADSIVRVRANDVRRRLAQYYSDHQASSKVTIHLASGTYIPEFQWPEPPAPDAKDVHVEPAADESLVHPETSADRTAHEPASAQSARNRWPITVFQIVAALILGCCLGWWANERVLDRSLNPWKYEPSVKALWSGFLDSGRETDIVLSDTSFQLIEEVSGQTFGLDDYLDRSYLEQAAQGAIPTTRSILSLIDSKTFGNSSEFRLAQRAFALGQVEDKVHIYNSRDFSSSLLSQDNVVLIGSGYTNPWEDLFDSRLNFAETPGHGSYGPIINKTPRAGESERYIPTADAGYCVVAYLPNPDDNTKALLIQGSSAEATEAGGDFVLSEDKLEGFMKLLKVQKLPYFEVLLKTSQAHGTAFAATVLAYRLHSGTQ